MVNIIKQWNSAASKYMKGQERSEFVESNKRVVQDRFKHFYGEKY